MEKLNIDEIMALQLFGMEGHEIIKLNLDDFEGFLTEHSDLNLLLDKANEIIDRQEEAGIVSFVWHDGQFPQRLRSIGKDCPAVIHCHGDTALLKDTKSVAVIGARAADSQGLEASFKLGKKFAEAGNVIVSGLALGCDTAAHKGCLEVGGKTIAIVGSGLNICHPIENKHLETRILEAGGLILSEQPFGIKANPRRLVARNRLQAALSESVILAQCPEKSGSMHTMRFARKYHKECLAVKYPRSTPANSGNDLLICTGMAESITV